ncbi:MAG: caspase family protein [Planctomycetota bacterium]|jgi:hypothetical protein
MTRIGILLLCAGAAHAQDGYEATLCRGWSEKGGAEGITNEFFSDQAAVHLVLKVPKGLVLGQSLQPVVVTDTRKIQIVVAEGLPFYAVPGRPQFHFQIPLAGRAWASRGGDFRFRVFLKGQKEPVADAPFKVKPGKRWALLVGIADYPPAGAVPNRTDGDLPMIANDVPRMRELLIDSFGFRKENITVVENLDATAARLRRELQALAERAGPNDAAVFYYCGHGTQVPDLDGDEEDGWDEALATADLRPDILTTAEHLKLVLTDDEIARLLKNFKTRNVTVIFDSCHSGTAVRAGEGEEDLDVDFASRGLNHELPIARKIVLAAKKAPRNTIQGIAAGLDIDQRYVFLAGARSWETGRAAPDGCIFSAELRDTLRKTDGRSWDQIIRQVRPQVHRRNVGQSPSAMGALRRYPFSLVEAPADAPFERPSLRALGALDPANPTVVYTMGKPGRIAIISGTETLSRESRGVECDVYPAYFGTKPHGRVRLTGKMATYKPTPDRAMPFAGAEILSGVVRSHDRLVPRTLRVPDPIPTLKFATRRSMTQAQFDAMRSAVQAMISQLKLDRSVRLFIQQQPPHMDYLLVPTMKDGKVMASVYTPNGGRVGETAGDGRALAAAVSRIARQRHDQFARFNRLSNPSPSHRLRLVVVGGENGRTAGERIECRMYAGKPCHFYVFTAMEGERPFFLTQTKAMHPANDDFKFGLVTKKGATGRLFVKVIASEKPLDVRGVNNAASLIVALRKAYPGTGTDFVATDGWADETVRIDYRR